MGDYLDCGAGGLQTVASAVHKPGITKQDRIRERELFRFYRPENADLEHDGASPPSSPPQNFDAGESPPITNKDVTLAALAQLVALRLGVHRAMINVIGRETQYTLVESTKTLDLVDQTTSETNGDEAWVGSGGSMHKALSLCENVVALPSDALEHPFLIIPDLSKDARFKDRPYVRGPPYYRFYAGTQLKTARGVVIGALCAFAHEPRTLSHTEQKYMGTISDTIMQHLEMRRAAAERDKVTRMSRGLNAFVEGKTSQYIATFDEKAVQEALSQPIAPMKPLPSPTRANPGLSEDKKVSDPMETDTAGDSVETKETQQQCPKETPPFVKPEKKPTSRGEPSRSSGIEEQFQATLFRASGLLNEALGLKDGGGVAFYDTMARIDTPVSDTSGTVTPTEKRDLDDWGSFSDGAMTPAAFDTLVDSEETRAPILGSLVSARYNETDPDESFRKFSSRLMSKLIKRYPAGRTWEFDEHGAIPGHEDGIVRVDAKSRQTAAEREVRQRIETEHLMAVFPGVRSLVFVPLWDANMSRHYAGCFAWTTDAMARFSADVELSFVTAFGNSISAEISRLATIDADQRKSDFIGSVSHELRSPLHGVLASAEFLADTKLDSFQSTLVNTIDSCGRTLLDTINHVLDFSKINSLRRTWKKNQKSHKLPAAQSAKDQKAAVHSSGIMSILGSTDVAAITEEVVDSIYAGKIYAKAFSPADITDVNASGSQRRDSEQPRWQDSSKSGVQVLLDISPGDYHFVTQPGAIRRIIMNIFGNALKYTEKGSIVVRLWQQPDGDEADGAKKIVLNIKDTGKGISTGYLRTRLYTPFAQENDLAPGTGLGLSIVRNIVTMLRGDISIRSKVGRGTEVRITIPNMVRPATVPNEKESSRSTLLDFAYLKERREDMAVGLYGFSSDRGTVSQETERILRRYLEEWCDVKHVTEARPGVFTDVVVVDELLLHQLERSGLVGAKDNIIVLCKNPAPVQAPQGTLSRHYFLLKPFGPYKLARTIRKCVERQKNWPNGRPVSFPRVLDVSVPNVGMDPAITLGQTTNAKMAVKESPEPAERSSGQNGALKPARPRLSSISPPGPSPRGSLAESRAEDAMEVAVDDGQSPERRENGRAGSLEPSEQAKTAMEEAQRNPQILVVDDNKTNRMLLQTFLKKRGLPADSAEDGGMAVHEATSKKYDIIFMDISMPVMNGFEATREIRRHEESVRKQYRRDSSSGAMRGSRPSSRIWQQGPITMTPSTSQQQHNMQYQLQPGLGDSESPTAATTPQIQGGVGNHASGVAADTAMSRNGSNGRSSNGSNGSRRDDGGGNDGPRIPAKPVTPPISPEEEGGEGMTVARLLKPTLIIALTGLASGRDQSEAFTSGVDLYMTKPVSFQEVGRLIDNWMANGGLVPATS